MVSTPDVDCSVKASYLKLVAVVSDISGKICGIAVCSDKNLVLELELFDFFGGFALFKKSCTENLFVLIPYGAVFFICKTLVLHNIKGFGELAAVVKCAFEEPGIVFDTVFCEIFFHCRNVFGQSVVNKSLSAFCFGCVNEFVAVDFGKLLRSDNDILAVVAVLGQLGGVGTLIKLLISDVERKTEFFNLVACVVDVEFAAYVIASAIHNRCKAVAECAASCVTHMHGTRGVGGNKFDIDFFAAAVVGAAVIVAFFKNILNDAGVKAFFEIEIEETGTCNLASVDERIAKLKAADDCFGNLSGGGAEVSCPCHGCV